MIVSLIRVTAPLRASARPSSVTPESTEIDVRARIVPANTEDVPSGAELPICQNTLPGAPATAGGPRTTRPHTTSDVGGDAFANVYAEGRDRRGGGPSGGGSIPLARAYGSGFEPAPPGKGL